MDNLSNNMKIKIKRIPNHCKEHQEKKINRIMKDLIDDFISYIKSWGKMKIGELNTKKRDISKRERALCSITIQLERTQNEEASF